MTIFAMLNFRLLKISCNNNNREKSPIRCKSTRKVAFRCSKSFGEYFDSYSIQKWYFSVRFNFNWEDLIFGVSYVKHSKIPQLLGKGKTIQGKNDLYENVSAEIICSIQSVQRKKERDRKGIESKRERVSERKRVRGGVECSTLSGNCVHLHTSYSLSWLNIYHP